MHCQTPLMDSSSTFTKQHDHLKHCAPLVKISKSPNQNNNNPFSILVFWVSKSLRSLCFRVHFSQKGLCLRTIQYPGMVIETTTTTTTTTTVLYASSSMEGLSLAEKKNEVVVQENGTLAADLIEEKGRESSFSSEFLSSETTTAHEEQSRSSTEDSSSSPSSMGWPVQEIAASSDCQKKHLENEKFEKQASALSEIEMMKERFAKLLLGEDMSGCGNGVPTALAISNAITNLCATIFGQLWRLEPLRAEKKSMWRREMEWLLSVSDHIVELTPNWQTFPDGSKLEVMTCRPRSDLYVNLPALCKLDNMLEILDSFVNTEFWYVDQGVIAPDADGPSSFRQAQRQEEKWWLPVPRVPPCGLHENSRKQLQHKRDCTNQILKAAMAINSITLAEMDIPESYLESLPKGKKIEAIARKGSMVKFKSELKEGKVYRISSFAVVSNSGNFMASEHECKIIFNERTKVTLEQASAIPMNVFTFKNTADILATGGESDYLIDIIGLATNVSREKQYPKAGNVTRMIEVEITDDKYGPYLSCKSTV